MGKWLAVLSLATGCASFSSVQTADTLGRGQVQAAVEPGVWGAAGQKLDAIPHVDAAVRFGVADRVDLGVRLGSSSIELMGKFLLTTPGDPSLAISLAPTVGGIFTRAGIINAALPVLVGFKLGRGHELVLGPRVQALFIYDGGTWLVVGGVGTSVGFLWRLTENFALMPEIAALYPALGATSASRVFAGLEAGGVFLQFKLGLVFGQFRPPERPQRRLQAAPPQAP